MATKNGNIKDKVKDKVEEKVEEKVVEKVEAVLSEEPIEMIPDAQPAGQNEINAYLIKTLSALAESIKQINAGLAEVYEKKAVEISEGAHERNDEGGKPDDYSGYAWKEKVTLRVFKGPGAMDDFFVRANGRPYLIRRGVTVTVPLAIAEAIKNHEEQNLRAAEMIKQLVEEAQQREAELEKR